MLIFGYACLAYATKINATALGKTPPHLVILLADDLGYNDVSFSGSGNRMLSPNLQQLVEEGVLLEHWTVFKFCSPSRSQTLVGRYAYHLGQQTELNLNPMTGCRADSLNATHKKFMCTVKCGLPTSFKMIPELLKTKGYKTHAFGKWHQGFFQRKYTPTHRGFDTYFGSYTNNDHNTHVDPYGHVPRGCPWWTPASNRSCPYPPPSKQKNHGDCTLYDLTNNSAPTTAGANGSFVNVAPRLNGTFTADLYAAEAVRVIRAHPDPATTPLFLYVAFTVVHSPVQAPAHFVAPYADPSSPRYVADPTRRVLGGMVTALDAACGAVVAALKAREGSMWENTVLFFSTDNGSPLSNGGSNAPLRGSKMTYWEGGVRGVAFVVSGSSAPGAPHALPLARRNTTWHGLAGQVDLYATLAGLAGVRPEALGGNSTGPVPPDSIDLWPALVSGGPSPRTEIVHNINGPHFAAAIRVGDYKLLRGHPNEAFRGSDGWSLPPPEEGKEVRTYNSSRHGIYTAAAATRASNTSRHCTGAACPCAASPCLFDVVHDKEEKHDLAAEMPEKVAELLARLAELEASEVPRATSGLCPETAEYNRGGEPDVSAPDGCAANWAGQHWQPWVADG